MGEHKGWIALDIDGTITDQLHHVPPEVCLYLKSLHKEGWQLIFITGRTFSFGFSVLRVLDFPFFVAVQNGADIIQMPEQRLVSRSYLPGDMIASLEKIYTDQEEDFIIYAGYQHGDFCYYRPSRFSSELMVHVEKIKALSPEPWRAVDTFDFAQNEAFPLIKCLGDETLMRRVNASLKEIEGVCASMIRDPLAEGVFLNLVTDRQADKGKALERAIAQFGKRGKVIAAGDDRNDISMLETADFSIVMQTAPAEMLEAADLIGKPATERGIIGALKEAIAHVG
ncbi:MAG: HAD family phosphatase [Parachlamydiales bacterium]|nr:HAD family phosphatase [Verrucomicrobiota bacterium]MBX3719622.1 HAD family phosphatase [Candidatus Acheromyda pituitae]